VNAGINGSNGSAGAKGDKGATGATGASGAASSAFSGSQVVVVNSKNQTKTLTIVKGLITRIR